MVGHLRVPNQTDEPIPSPAARDGYRQTLCPSVVSRQPKCIPPHL